MAGKTLRRHLSDTNAAILLAKTPEELQDIKARAPAAVQRLARHTLVQTHMQVLEGTGASPVGIGSSA